jgi:hypothetical protein
MAKIGAGMLKGIGGIKGSAGKPKLPRKKKPGTMSTNMYRQSKYK